jgi:hypothetical protein
MSKHKWQTKYGTCPRPQRRRNFADAEEYDPEKICRKNPLLGPPPCFFFDKCRAQADRCKQGKAVCAECAANLPGQELPLKDPRAPVPYASAADIIHAMHMDSIPARAGAPARFLMGGRA